MLQFNPDWRFDSPGALSPETYRGLCEWMRPMVTHNVRPFVVLPCVHDAAFDKFARLNFFGPNWNVVDQIAGCNADHRQSNNESNHVEHSLLFGLQSPCYFG
jgi:hypothetical protein